MKHINDYFWAKKTEENSRLLWLPLTQHLEDTKNIAGLLWEHWLSEGQKILIENSINVKSNIENQGKRLAQFLGAVHDIGKATPAFQTQKGYANSVDLDIQLLEKLERAGFSGISSLQLASPKKSHHSIAGQYLLSHYGVDEDIATIIGGHHGRPVDDLDGLNSQKSYPSNYYQDEKKDNTLFETLLLNYISPYNECGNVENIQRPCWERKSSDIIKSYLDEKDITNIASLYTVWSKGIYIDPDFNLNKPFSFDIVKLPDINHRDNFLEPMTLWKYNVSGKNRDSYTPKKHLLNQSLWRSFGLLSIKGTDLQHRKPGVIEWLTYIDDIIGNRLSNIVAISMQDDGNPQSRLPTDEVIDSIFINDLVLTDLDEGGWVPRINEVVEETKKIISRTYKTYINDIKEIRNISNGSYTQQIVESLYFKIDQPFRQWLASIQPEDDKDSKIQEWRVLLKKIVKAEAEVILHQGGARDYLGIQKDGRIKNIATAYNSFDFWLRQQLK